ncbi:hypothetical protein N7495_000575 [Penicillium taxi]|uniref:uncharacterized protein n=1 Tax=Penicillium taxi TaxID=168475 RepID=UPI0025455DAD|nr:uncharacterized protein N7495_000575 [Penicillium taxi]KAJ5907893.1 hypothetical protein N7495_000575 [Penicillium taxi]
MSIRPLSPDVVAKIKSSTSITHLSGVILELVKNSLDAHATTVYVSVDFKRGSCIVEDDGDGIKPIEFKPNGGIGKAHHTSKFQNDSSYGHRGLFLASLASLSLLTVTSHHIQHQTTNSIILHHSNSVARLIPAPEHHEIRISNHGTSVTVNDLFGNMPVRVKSRALALLKPDELDREWEHLRYTLIAIMLANSQLYKLIISDVERGKRITIRSGGTGTPTTGEVDLTRIGSILKQSDMIGSQNMDSWHVISASITDLTISAAMSTDPSPSKKLQFLSLGNEPVLSQSNSNVLFNEVNRLMAMSDFGSTENSSQLNTTTSSSLRLGHIDATGSTSGRSSTRSTKKWPMFYIRIDTGSVRHLRNGYESTPDSERSIQRITDVLGAMILEFLKQQDLRPRVSRRRRKISDQSHLAAPFAPSSDRPSENSVVPGVASSSEETFSSHFKLPSLHQSLPRAPGDHLNSWSRVKTAKHSKPTRLAVATPNREVQSAGEQSQSHVHRMQHGIRSPLAQHNQSHQESGTCETNEPRLDNASQFSSAFLVPWLDPHTGKTHMIDSRTGQTVNQKEFTGGSRSMAHISLPERRKIIREPQNSQHIWVDNFLKSWDNPTFTRTEIPVPSLDTDTNYLDNAASSHGYFQGIGSLNTSQVAKFKGRLQRKSLATANIIAQVDQKFILAKLDASITQVFGEPENILVLIDQHAADERCRIEKLFEEMFEPPEFSDTTSRVRVVEIDPFKFGISFAEIPLFRKYLDFFWGWGIRYSLATEKDFEATVFVHAVPNLVAERCRLEPAIIPDLLRREMWTYEEDYGKPISSKSISSKKRTAFEPCPADDTAPISSDPFPWIHQMSGCPQGIIDLLNSRACRGAIMFNDLLSTDECKTLVSRLARCAFPFQCAHGRPSMIPILDLRPQHLKDQPSLCEEGASIFDEQDRLDLSFVEAFKKRYNY